MKNQHTHIILIGLLLLLIGFNSCKKVEHGISEPIVSINETTPSAVQAGQSLKVGFISNNVRSFQIAIVKDSEVLLSEEVSLNEAERIIYRELLIANEASWIGEAQLVLSYDAGGERIEKKKPLLISESNPEMYLVGGSTGAGWVPELATPMFLYNSESKEQFDIFEYITVNGDGFKFVPSTSGWDNAYGKGAASGVLLQDEDAENITVDKDDFYRVRMDAKALTYELLKVTWGIVGDATAGGWENSTAMVFSGDKGNYTWKITTSLNKGELKFRYNNEWDIDGFPANLGGDLSNLTWGAGNIAIESAGTYIIELNLDPKGYTAKIDKQ
ncbi:SusF/SusE family outer membrane protein [Sphingobacterium sp. UT-1RO-CII-1]|uniref:SusF/SusE family outer membrane protein n=1 Tax=Sphingobacterium sp. UT-1RO-CII-1 TaxID=2995225 RepID=UPI00227B8F08|nr:SusF/SusE family outer membrane protein [Sphingobacterium sp. UT-1RO-CII-1]MCY4779297.1 SusF/SusE family outer membrane protein [Sphingobacterium sp. UT-1RO-CII-1]